MHAEVAITKTPDLGQMIGRLERAVGELDAQTGRVRG
jgi:hypothetical protein